MTINFCIAQHYYHRATNLLASQSVHGLVADLATSAAHIHASIFREQSDGGGAPHAAPWGGT
jgi:hypothetical protein